MHTHTQVHTHIYTRTNTSLSTTNASWPRCHFLQHEHYFMIFQQNWSFSSFVGSFLQNRLCIPIAALCIICKFTGQTQRTHMSLCGKWYTICINLCPAQLNLPHYRILHDKQFNLVIFKPLVKVIFFPQRTQLFVLYSILLNFQKSAAAWGKQNLGQGLRSGSEFKFIVCLQVMFIKYNFQNDTFFCLALLR